MKRVLFLLPTLIVAAACGGSTTELAGGTGGGSAAAGTSSGSTGSTGNGGGATTGSGGGTPGESYTVTFDPVTVSPGAESTQCVVRRVGNDGAVHIGEIHNVLSTASHHLIVYRTTDTMEQPKPFSCTPFSDLLKPEKGTPLMITQKHDDTLTLPPGVALSFAPNQMVRLEMHYLNTSSADVQAEATVTFKVMPEANVKDEADFLFIGNPDINIGAHSKKTIGPSYLPMPKNLVGSNFFGVTGHTHQYGTNVTVATTTGKTGTDTLVYDVPNWSWSEPETVYHDPAFQVPDEGGFRFSCSWNNTSDHTVKFGESANDEMCFFWTYYYPSAGAFVCVHSDQFGGPGGTNICCPGNPACGFLLP